MKQLKYFLSGILCLMMMYSCNDWLSVSPKTEMPQENLFKTQRGFQDALIGVYIQLKDGPAYGRELTMDMPEHLVSFWDVTKNTTPQNFTYHNYTDAGCENTIKNTYAALYKMIANLNTILEKVDDAKKNGVFTIDGYYELVKGEALALRAFCHLDILRLFGPVPARANGSNILPYVTKLSKIPTAHVSYAEYCRLLLADLNAAAGLLKEKDPITDLTIKPTNAPALDLFFANRSVRFNYYAVKALQARANLYMGNKQEACEAAKEVISVTKEDGTKLFNLGVLADLTTAKDYTLRKEHIFALSDHKLVDTYKFYFLTGSFKKGSTHAAVVNALFDAESASDIRVNLWMTIQNGSGTNMAINKKYFAEDDENIKTTNVYRIPLLRLSELYLILAEAAPLTEAQTYWETYRKSRNIAVTTLAENSRRNEIMKEYRKEFYAEGQMFYFHKRVDSPKTDIKWFPTVAAANLNYVLPLPKTELINN